MSALSIETRPLFKYTHSKYMMPMLTFGHLRIGTLHDFQKVEKYGTEIGDHGEGTKTLYEDGVNFSGWGSHVPPIAKKVLKYPNGIRSVEVRDCTFTYVERSPNCYVYSVTEEFDEKAMKAFGYDACVRIDNPEMFFHELSRCIEKKRKIVDGFMDRCIYTNRRQQYSQQDRSHPAFIKPPDLAHQKEVRAIWIPPQDEQIPPFFYVTCPELRQYFSQYSPG